MIVRRNTITDSFKKLEHSSYGLEMRLCMIEIKKGVPKYFRILSHPFFIINLYPHHSSLFGRNGRDVCDDDASGAEVAGIPVGRGDPSFFYDELLLVWVDDGADGLCPHRLVKYDNLGFHQLHSFDFQGKRQQSGQLKRLR